MYFNQEPLLLNWIEESILELLNTLIAQMGGNYSIWLYRICFDTYSQIRHRNECTYWQKEGALFFKTLANSNKSEFIAVYGRRRVGKTFLIRQAFEHKFSFQVTAIANAKTSQQLYNFNIALQ